MTDDNHAHMSETFTYSFGDAVWSVTLNPTSLSVTSTHHVTFDVPLTTLERFAVFVTAHSLSPTHTKPPRTWAHFERWRSSTPHHVSTAQLWLRWHTPEGRICVDKLPFDLNIDTCHDLLTALHTTCPNAFVGFGDHTFATRALGLQSRADLWTALAILTFVVAMAIILLLSRRSDDLTSW